ncbi:MAG: MFS transporter [Shimia sp.]
MRLILSFAALFLSVLLLQLSSGGVGPLDAVVGLGLGMSRTEVGLLGSAHFAGFFIGCWWAPRLMGTVGYARAFAAFTALGAIGLLGHTLTTEPLAWMAFRVGSGLCIAGCYTVIEAWLQAKVTNETRGRSMGIYRAVDLSGSLVAQGMIGVLATLEVYVAYNLLAILCCASLLPLVLTTRAPAVDAGAAPRLRPVLAFARSPLAVAGVVVAGLTASAYRMVGPIYGAEVGLTPGALGLFLAAFVAGGALAQVPAGWAADRYDRRWVLIGFALAALVGCGVSSIVSGSSAVIAASLLFGAVTFPLYSISAAHAHDFAESHERAELSAALLFFFACGAILAPLLTARLIETFGPRSFFAFIAAGHIALALYGFWRMTRREALTRTSYIYAPRTSFLVGRLLGRSRERGEDGPE